jgi:hypothetical protein
MDGPYGANAHQKGYGESAETGRSMRYNWAWGSIRKSQTGGILDGSKWAVVSEYYNGTAGNVYGSGKSGFLRDNWNDCCHKIVKR